MVLYKTYIIDVAREKMLQLAGATFINARSKT